MNRVEIFENGRTASIPASWGEMSPRQVCKTFRLYDHCVKNGRSPLEFSVRILYMLLGIRISSFKGLFHGILRRKSPDHRPENVYRLCERTVGYIFSPETATLAFDSISNPLPTIRSGLRRLYGPGELLQDLTFGEFRHASVAINKFYSSKDVSDLDEAIAFLYRVKGKRANRAGRKVAEIDSRNASKHIQRAKRLPPWKKNLIMMWFAACLNYLQNGIVELDGESVDLSLLFSKSEGKTSGVTFGWNDLLIELAKENTLGNIDRVDEEPFFSVLSIMWHNYKDRKRDEQITKAP